MWEGKEFFDKAYNILIYLSLLALTGKYRCGDRGINCCGIARNDKLSYAIARYITVGCYASKKEG